MTELEANPTGSASWNRTWFWRSVTGLLLVVVGWVASLWGPVATCSNLEIAGSFAGSKARFVDVALNHHYDGKCLASGNRAFWSHLALGAAFSLAYGAILFFICHRWWARAWVNRTIARAKWVKWLAVVAAVCDVVENLTLGSTVRIASPVEVTMNDVVATVMPVIAWVKLLSFVAAFFAALCTLAAAWSHRKLRGAISSGEQPYAHLPISGFGISCSGGGIRAASISLGALGVLERTTLTETADGEIMIAAAGPGTGLLYDAKYLASVSGGGYTAGAWRAASRDTPPIAPTSPPANGASNSQPPGWANGVIGDPLDYPDRAPHAADSEVGPGSPSLFRHLLQRREFLRSGRGGFSSSLLATFAFGIWNLFILAILLVALAWPLGWLSGTWFVYGGTGCRTTYGVQGPIYYPKFRKPPLDGYDIPISACSKRANEFNKAHPLKAEVIGNRRVVTQQHLADPLLRLSRNRTVLFLKNRGSDTNTFQRRMYSPSLLFGAMGLMCFLLSMTQWNTRRRRRVVATGVACLGAAVTIGLPLMVMPWLLDNVYPYLQSWKVGLPTLAVFTSGTGMVGIIMGTARNFLRRRIAYLGGALLVIAGFLLALEVIGDAARGAGALSFSGKGLLTPPAGGVYLAAFVAFCYAVLCPRWWSLHTLYRNRLRSAFITSRDSVSAPRSLPRRPRTIMNGSGQSTGTKERPSDRMWPVEQRKEPLLDRYRGAPGPIHLVCCAAARSDNSVTGVKALSYVISADHVELHDVTYTAKGLATTTYRADTKAWLAALGNKGDRQAEGTLSAAMSVSGAAVAPSMGRLNLGTTNALFAALNLRLGTWYPHPRYVGDSLAGRFPKVRMSYLGKEVLGSFDITDHHLYVTDGGHRENLGLVELLRRRCETMFCIDASGDTPGSYSTLREAAELARVEVGATIDLSSLPATLEPRPVSAHTILPVTYRDTTTGLVVGHGTVIHIAPILFEQLPDDVIAYSLQDPRFPHYSTGDQFLTEDQFRRLVLFGRAAADAALRTDPVVRSTLSSAIHPASPAPVNPDPHPGEPTDIIDLGGDADALANR